MPKLETLNEALSPISDKADAPESSRVTPEAAPVNYTTSISPADSLTQKWEERRRIEKELEAVKQQALERTLRSMGYPAIAGLGFLPGHSISTTFAAQTPLFLNGQQQSVSPPVETKEDAGSAEPEDLTVKGKESAELDVGDEEEETGGEAADSGSSGQPTWSYEEQFKHLYEIQDDKTDPKKRKEWLDDWLTFMHRIGKPVTRIPIMAKQVLDLYQLYHLVVAHGGLVEIIHKKLWREITKGLNLPSSITSAAFTLRTQYQKYLYDYECEKEGLSKPEDLQAAIEGNRREGRRNNASYSPYSMAPSLLTQKHSLMREEDSVVPAALPSASLAGQHAALAAVAYREQLAALEARRQLEQARKAAMEAASQQQQPNSGRVSTSSNDSEDPGLGPPPPKRPQMDDSLERMVCNLSSAHLKVTSRGSGNNSLIVSMEINGVMYQGVLFAQPPTPTHLSTNPSSL